MSLQQLDSGIIPVSLSTLRAGLFAGASVRKASDQTTANYSGAGAAVAWDSEILDVGGWHDNSTNNTRLTVPSGLGITKVLAIANIVTLLNSNIGYALLKKNGSAGFDGQGAVTFGPISSGSDAYANICTLISCTAGDFFETLIFTSDTSITVSAAYSNFSIMAVG